MPNGGGMRKGGREEVLISVLDGCVADLKVPYQRIYYSGKGSLTTPWPLEVCKLLQTYQRLSKGFSNS